MGPSGDGEGDGVEVGTGGLGMSYISIDLLARPWQTTNYQPPAHKTRKLEKTELSKETRFYYVNMPHNLSIQIGLTLNSIFHLGLPGKCL